MGQMPSLKKKLRTDDLEKIITTQQEFISFVGHELRNPLTIMQGYIQLTKRKLGNKKIPEADWTMEIAKANSKLMRLVNQMLLLNRIKSGRIIYDLQECNLIGITEKAADLFQATYPERKIIIKKTKETNLPVIGDSEKLINLLYDCLEFLEKISLVNAPLRLSLELEVSYYRIALSSNVEELTWKKTKEKLSKLLKGEENYTDGIPLGIFLADYVAREHKGGLKVITDPGKEMVIEIKLPKIKIK